MSEQEVVDIVEPRMDKHVEQTDNKEEGASSIFPPETDQTSNNPALNQEELEAAILKQVEYYFSPKNLVRDVFLNKEMSKDPNKFVNISVLTTFNKLKALSTDVNFIANVLRKSSELTVSEDNERVRSNTPGSRTILDKTFSDRDEIQAFFQTIFLKYSKGEDLAESDRKYVEGLLEYHTNKEAKIGSGIASIRIGSAVGHDDTLCFVIVRTDGTIEDFSYLKCINNLDPTHNIKKRKMDFKEKPKKAFP
jgi:hypothetical protein